jgi:hypothetical protein
LRDWFLQRFCAKGLKGRKQSRLHYIVVHINSLFHVPFKNDTFYFFKNLSAFFQFASNIMLSNILSHIIIFVLVAIFGSIQCSVQAKITIYDKDWDPIVVSSTYDRFHVRTEYYDKKGFLLNIGFNSTLSSCTFNRLRSHMKIASTVVASAPTYSSFAYLVNWAEAVARRCGTVENVSVC